MRRFFDFALAVAMAFALAVPTTALCDEFDRQEIARKVSQLVELLKDGYASEYEEARGIHVVDFGREDKIAVAIFDVSGFSGGNNATQFMAVFDSLSLGSKENPARISLLDVTRVGARGWRFADFEKVNARRQGKHILIDLSTQEYTPQDALCCPSRRSRATYTITPEVGGRLQEVKK